MSKIRAIYSALTTAMFFALPSLAQAGSPSSFGFSLLPAPAPVAAAAAEPVPLLNDVMLVALGLLLLVVAYRTLRSNRTYQKMLSVVVLAGGLLVGGMGAERTIADAVDFVFGSGPEEFACEDATGIEYSGAPTVTNNCELPAAITPVAQGVCLQLVGGDCDVLDPGGSCTLPGVEPVPESECFPP